jgi:CRP-like cAMP-binding protein
MRRRPKPKPDTHSPVLGVRLKAVGLMAAARASTRRDLEQSGTLVVFTIGSMIWRDDVGYIAVVQSGRARLEVVHHDHLAVTLGFLRTGDVAGLLESHATKRFPTICHATSIVTALIIPIQVVRAAIDQDQELRAAVLERAASETVQLRQRLLEMATLSIQARLASYLLESCDEDRELSDIRNPPTHQELASLLGTNREAITRSLRLFEAMGIIRYSRQTIRILSVTKLISLLEKG